MLSADIPFFSVSELSQKIRIHLEEEFFFVRVKGELSSTKAHHTSGHIYFALKDQESVIDGVIWRNQAINLAFVPEDGMEVVCTGRVTTYPGRSKYQIIVNNMEVAGQGALLKLIEERKQKLAAEGLFNIDRKKLLPRFPEKIGVITSSTGAVIRDILHRIAERFPLQVLLWPVSVQGTTAAQEIRNAIDGFNKLELSHPLRPDILIVARGGGSVEDLWAFHDEEVVRAVVRSRIPVVSAVGHETDTTLIDYAADQRAPTPTAAAEMVTPVRMDYLEILHQLGISLYKILQNQLLFFQEKLRFSQVKIDQVHARLIFIDQRLDDLENRLLRALGGVHAFWEQRLWGLEKSLSGYSYEHTLKRGFVIVRDKWGKPIPSKKDFGNTAEFDLQFQDGSCHIYSHSFQKKEKKKKLVGGQKSLFEA